LRASRKSWYSNGVVAGARPKLLPAKAAPATQGLGGCRVRRGPPGFSMHLSIGGQCDANHRMRPRNADLRRAGVPHRGRGSSGSWKRRSDGATGTSPWYSSPTGTAYGLPSWSTSTGLPSSTPNGPLGCHPRRGPADRRQRRRGLAARICRIRLRVHHRHVDLRRFAGTLGATKLDCFPIWGTFGRGLATPAQ
jgi:hypothetical protein